MYRITFMSGPAKGRKLTVRAGSVRIGRGPDCAVRVSDPAMADRHAQIEERQGRLFLVNLDGLHGMDVDGRRMAGTEQELTGRERIKIGQTLVRIERMESGGRVRPRRLTGIQVLAFLAMVVVVAWQGWIILNFSSIPRPVPDEETPPPSLETVPPAPPASGVEPAEPVPAVPGPAGAESAPPASGSPPLPPPAATNAALAEEALGPPEAPPSPAPDAPVPEEKGKTPNPPAPGNGNPPDPAPAPA